MITKNGKIKCDKCGKFIAVTKHKVVYTPDSPYSIERFEDYHKACITK